MSEKEMSEKRMSEKGLIFHSLRQTGSLGFHTASDFKRLLGVPEVFETNEMMRVFSNKEYDWILLLDCIEDYLGRRLAVRGRPWVCAISTVFADLYSTYRNNLKSSEMNIHKIISNCRTFVDHSKGMGVFSYPPVPEFSDTGFEWMNIQDGGFSCVVPNIEDRDWSLASLVVYTLKEMNVTLSISYLHSGYQDKLKVKQLPNILIENEIFPRPVGKVYIPAPRITDYRAGVIPSEILFFNSLPGSNRRLILTIAHQCLEPVLPYIHAVKNISQLKLALSAIVSGAKIAMPPEMPSNFYPRPKAIVEEIIKPAYLEWRGANENSS